MHETGIVRDLLSAALEAAAGAGATKILRVRVVIRGVTGVTEEAIRFLFAALGRGTAAEGAEVLVRSEPPAVTCRTCGHTGIGMHEPACSSCGGCELEIRGDRGSYLESIDVEEA